MHCTGAGQVSPTRRGFSTASRSRPSPPAAPRCTPWMHRNPELRLLPVAQVTTRQSSARTAAWSASTVRWGSSQIMRPGSLGRRLASGSLGRSAVTSCSSIGAHDMPGGQEHHLPALDSEWSAASASRTILSQLPGGTPVTTPRHHVQYVVTEHRGRPPRLCATARGARHGMIGNRPPGVRDQLRAATTARVSARCCVSAPPSHRHLAARCTARSLTHLDELRARAH
jgi:hypothetical protein